CNGTHFGQDCQNECKCQKEAICDSIDGTCTCADGYRGKFCESKCLSGDYGERCQQRCKCKNGGQCDHVTGKCTCKDGFYNDFCEECPDGNYGKNCSMPCLCRNGGDCNKVTGDCDCLKPGFHGKFCENDCGNWTYGKNCQQQCSCFTMNSKDCDGDTGTCNCKDGFVGSACTKICPDGKSLDNPGSYGPDCKETCDCDFRNSNRSYTCDPQSGQCFCKAGWKGRSCTQPCDEKHFGNGCLPCECSLDFMKGSCDQFNGSCHCLDGYQGNYCNETCPFGFYGAGCLSKCGQCSTSCDHRVGCVREEQSSGGEIRTIAIGGVGGLVVVVVVIVGLVVCRRRGALGGGESKKRESNGGYELQEKDNIYSNKDLYEDFQTSGSHQSPVYDSTSDPNIPNPIYSTANNIQPQDYDQLFKHNSKKVKPTPDTYSKLGPSSDLLVPQGNENMRYSNVHTNSIYGTVDEPQASGYQNTTFEGEDYDSLNRNSTTRENDVYPNPAYDHLGNNTIPPVVEDEYAVVNKTPKGKTPNPHVENPMYDAPDKRGISNDLLHGKPLSNTIENETYDSLNHENILGNPQFPKGNQNKGYSNVMSNDIYDALDHSQQPAQDFHQINETYDSLHACARPESNVMINDTYDSLDHQNPNPPTSSVDDLYAPVIKPNKSNHDNITPNETYDILQHPNSNNVTPNDLYAPVIKNKTDSNPPNIMLNDTYDSVNQATPGTGPSVMPDDLYAPVIKKPASNNNVLLNETYDSLNSNHNGGRSRGNSNIMVNDTYDSLQHPQNTENDYAPIGGAGEVASTIYDSIEPPRQPLPQTSSMSMSDMLSKLSESEYNTLHENIANSQPNYDHLTLMREPTKKSPSPILGKPKDYKRLGEEEYSTPNVVGFAGNQNEKQEKKTKKNKKDKKEKKGKK
uniref:EGF-like domain-containing protein n=1 Tax=Clytia hemisphaerica TaxID=252671 RepID=A0A7M5X2G3_9CNID